MPPQQPRPTLPPLAKSHLLSLPTRSKTPPPTRHTLPFRTTLPQQATYCLFATSAVSNLLFGYIHSTMLQLQLPFVYDRSAGVFAIHTTWDDSPVMLNVGDMPRKAAGLFWGVNGFGRVHQISGGLRQRSPRMSDCDACDGMSDVTEEEDSEVGEKEDSCMAEMLAELEAVFDGRFQIAIAGAGMIPVCVSVVKEGEAALVRRRVVGV